MKYEVVLGGKKFEVEVEEGKAVVVNETAYTAPAAAPAPAPAAAPAPAPAAAPAAAPAPAGSGNAVTSPLPGTVLNIKVAAGQAVKAGDILVIIEAMKMENEIVAPADGTVTSIVASNGQTVDSGAVLLYLA